MTHDTAETAGLPAQAAQILTAFNNRGMTGPTLPLDQIEAALAGLISLMNSLPNALRHVGGHLLDNQRRGNLAAIDGSDTDDIAERVRQRMSDCAAPLNEILAKVDGTLPLIHRLTPNVDSPSILTEAVEQDDAAPLLPANVAGKDVVVTAAGRCGRAGRAGPGSAGSGGSSRRGTRPPPRS
ncbi:MULTISPECIES: hypothetical protein [unclassified Kitasatospora]|uniref:hypothetical protein n=1 Tax=unclassified Kitasatospora TaxID=2633591 RepID=UPI0033E17C9A